MANGLECRTERRKITSREFVVEEDCPKTVRMCVCARARVRVCCACVDRRCSPFQLFACVCACVSARVQVVVDDDGPKNSVRVCVCPCA